MQKKSTFIDLTGQQFGRWFVIKESHRAGKIGYYWECRCDCGTIRAVSGSSLKMGKSKSCGCLFREVLLKRITTHGGTNSPEYGIWEAIRGRCLSPGHSAYKHYGGRGITICARWVNFSNFLADMGKRPSLKHSIDRIDNNGNYEPGNCRWVTQGQQCQNSRRTVRLEVEGIEMALGRACRRYGMDYSNISRKVLKSDYSHQEAFNEAVLRRGFRPLDNFLGE